MFTIDAQPFESRLWLGTAGYPSLDILKAAITHSGTELLTVSLKRETVAPRKPNLFFETIKQMSCRLLPNTAGCRSAKEAVYVSKMSRDLFETDWIKLEVTGDDFTLQPDSLELIKAAEQLLALDFTVFPYCTDDFVMCKRLHELGCPALMPGAAPIGSGQGILNPTQLKILRERLADAILIVDAGIGRPSDAAWIMEIGFDAVLLNSAISLSADPANMASAFKQAISAGRQAFEAGIIPKRNMAVPSTALPDTPFWQQANHNQ